MRTLVTLSVFAAACTTYVAEQGPNGVDRARDDQVGGVVITEVMIDPDACEDRAAEYIEIRNVGQQDIDLNTFALVNRAGTRAPIAAEHPIRPGETAMIGRGEWDTFCVGQWHPRNYFDGALDLNNEAEQLSLVDAEGKVVDTTPLFTGSWIVEGSSISLRPDAVEAWSNDALDAWYLGSDCVNTSGNSGGSPNSECFEEVGWFGVECDAFGCDLPADFDPTEHLREAHALASGYADEIVDVEREGMYFHNLRFEPPAPVDTDEFVPGEAHWEVTFVTYSDDLWGYKDLFVTLDINAGTVDVYEDFGSDSLAKVRVEELDTIRVTADSVVDALDRSWSWWDDVGYGALNRAVYEDTLRWTVVSDDGDERWEYDATTGERTDW